jgi:secreted PhoX family phosphatase
MEKNQNNVMEYKDEDVSLDYEYDFYNTYLSEYANQDGNELVPVSKEVASFFMALNQEYSNSKDISPDQRNTEAKLADSFMFYVAAGVIVMVNNEYFINVKKLANLTNDFNAISEKKGISFTKGSFK